MGQRIVLLPPYTEALTLRGLVKTILRRRDTVVLVINCCDGAGASRARIAAGERGYVQWSCVGRART